MNATAPQTFDDLVKLCLSLQERCQRLQELVCNTPRLHRKDLMRRYGISEDTLDRWLKRGLLPPPIRIRGKLWRPEDLEAMEEAGQLPCPVSS